MSVPEDVEGRCLSCIYCYSGCGDYYCKSDRKLAEWKKEEHNLAFNSFFSPRFDGIGCEFYEYD